MKPAAFEYLAPRTLEEALEIKKEHGEEAKILAGGQSLIPAMNFRVAQPTLLLDLNHIDELRYIDEDEGGIKIGAMTTQRTVEKSDLVNKSNPLVSETIPYIAHPQIRNRGTFGGSLAHADPAAELPVIATALEAKFKAQSAAGERWLTAKEFLVGMFTVGLEPEEMLTEVVIPEFPKNCGWAFVEIARRHGDYAMAGVAALITVGSDSKCEAAKLVYLNVGDGPVDAEEAANQIVGNELTNELIEAAAETASEKEIMPFGNVHVTPEYQKHLSKTLTQRAINIAISRVGTYPNGSAK